MRACPFATKAIPPPDDAIRLDDEAALRDKIEKLLKAQWGMVADRIQAGESVDLNGFDLNLRTLIEQALTATASDQLARNANAAGFEFDPTAYDAAARQWARQYSYDLVPGITARTREVVSHAITSYTEAQGMTFGDLTNLLEPAFGKDRASAIAITETTRAYAQGAQIYQGMLADEGIEMEQVWHTNADDIVCIICRPLNGKPESEWNGVTQPAHVGCRCGTGLRIKR
jgi:hypothetical protein